MKLYISPGACSLAAHIALEESGLKYEWEKIDVKNKTVAAGDYLKINSRGQVPALQLANGQVLTEGAVILQYIADQVSEKKLIPKFGTFERYRAMEWLNYVATEIHKNFSPLFAVDRWMTTDEGKNQLRSAAKANLDTRFKWLNGQIAPGQYLMGQDFCAADAYLYTCLRWSKSMSIDMTAYPNLMGFVEKLQNRPAVQKVLKDESLA